MSTFLALSRTVEVGLEAGFFLFIALMLYLGWGGPRRK